MACNVDSIKSAYYNDLSEDIRERYDEKIEKCGGIDPYTIKPYELSQASKDFPQITRYDIRDYMIHSVSRITMQFIDNFKGTEGYKYFHSGFVLDIGAKKINQSAIVKGKVKHSQRMNESPLKVWILANLDGTIICAHCTCIAGLSETCSHVGAICFAINKIAESKETKSVTDVLCKWNVPSFKQASMSSAKTINWRIQSNERHAHESSFLEYCNSLTQLSDERIDQFVLKCHSDGDDTALGTLIFPSERKRKTNLRDEIFLASLYDENYCDKNLSELVEIGKIMSLKLSSDEAKKISELTLPRLNSKCSLGLRRGRITGSNFKHCCVTNAKEPSLTTIRRVMNPTKSLDHISSIKYQIQHRKTSIQVYNRMAEEKHEDFVYNECGLIINPDIPYFVGSPDGLVYCSCHGDGCLEIKCLNIQEPDALDEFLTRKPKNIFNKFGNQYVPEQSHEFYYKIQLQINLTNLKYCDYIIWSPQKSFVVRVNADIEFWTSMMKKAISFHEQVVMPELLAKFYTEKIDLPNSIEDNDDEVELEDFELLALEIETLETTEE